MSAVGSDAAILLERALEEMDDIFRDTEEPKTFIHSSPEPPLLPPKMSKKMFTNVSSVTKVFDDLEFLLSGEILDRQDEISQEEMQTIHAHVHSLNLVSKLLQDLIVPYSNQDTQGYLKGPEEKIHSLEQERRLLQTTVNKFHEQLIFTQAELDRTKKTLTDYARKNEELLIRITEYRIAANKTKKTVNHNQLLLEDDEGNGEMDRLKNQIDTMLDKEQKKKLEDEESTAALKARLRDKASECNRLKLQLEDLRQAQESKDNTILKIQQQIQRLFEENEILRQQLANATSLHTNGTQTYSRCKENYNSEMVNGSTPRTPESVRSVATKNSSFKTKDLFQMKGLKSASEPNLIREPGQATVGLISSSMSVNGDDAIYRPFRRQISDTPFGSWSTDLVQDWLRDEGLEEYANNCSKCIKRGEELLKFTYADYERELGITDPLLKKKLNLALKAVTSNGPDYAGRLDHHWVARWLEDLGLPQYRLNFLQHKVDGRVLVNMTVDDILQLKVYSLLHHTSLKRAVQFLRHQKFHPQYLREVANQSEERCDHVMLWNSQRIVHWLRSVDLAEYAPNLRGSGVHGALMVLEPRFNADTLANLLSIPTNKSLLRRHVYTQYSTLLGDACQRQKEMTQKTSDFVPLNGSEKHKLRKKGIKSFGTLRRRKSETDLETLVCPMELDVSNIYSPPPALDPEVIFDLSESTSLSPSFTNDNGSESTNDTSAGPRIAELSHEIDQMTSMLGDH